METVYCQRCGAPRKTPRPDLVKYCGAACRMAASRERVKKREGTDTYREALRIRKKRLENGTVTKWDNECSECGDGISSRATTCSDRCRKARQRRLKELDELDPVIELEVLRRLEKLEPRSVQLTDDEWQAIRDRMKSINGAWIKDKKLPGFEGPQWKAFLQGRRTVLTFEQILALVGYYPEAVETLVPEV